MFLNALEQELTVGWGSHNMDPRNWTLEFCKTSKSSQPLSHFSSPTIYISQKFQAEVDAAGLESTSKSNCSTKSPSYATQNHFNERRVILHKLYIFWSLCVKDKTWMEMNYFRRANIGLSVASNASHLYDINNAAVATLLTGTQNRMVSSLK